MTNVNTQKYLPLGLALLGLLISPFIMRALGLTPGTATDVVIYAMAALGLNLLVGHTGLTSFGHGAFFGIGASDLLSEFAKIYSHIYWNLLYKR